MNLFKKLFGFNELSKYSKDILSDISTIHNQFLEFQKSLNNHSIQNTQIEKNNNELKEKTNELNSQVSKILTKHISIEKTIDDISTILITEQNENNKIESELIKLTELLNPKNEIYNNLNLIDPISNINLFTFEKLDYKVENVNKKIIDNNPNRILQIIGSIPEFITGGLLSKSYRFNYPKGVVGKIMSIGNGQGSAITNNGKIIAHGYYVSNLLISIPLLAYSVSNLIIKQHYLSKININLREINSKLDTIIQLEFIKKSSKVESIIFFFKKVYWQFDLIIENESYKNAILSNVILKNIEIFELIHFYKNSINEIKKDKIEQFQYNFQFFLVLQELFVFGKLLEFKYANEFNKKIIENTLTEFKDLKDIYSTFLLINEGELHNLSNSININFFDKIYSKRKSEKNQRKENLNNNRNFVNELREENENKFEQNKSLLIDFLGKLEKPQEFLIEDGKLYEIEI